MWVLIDNNDSFTHILADTISCFDVPIVVLNCDNTTIEEVIALRPKRVIIAPGPGKPEEAYLSRAVFNYFYNKIPILGICLGHQIIGTFFGAACVPSGKPMHGIVSTLNVIKKDTIFLNIENKTVMHYHSLILKQLPMDKLELLAVDEEDNVMAIRHKHLPIVGLQFHPESILTKEGKKMIANWIKTP